MAVSGEGLVGSLRVLTSSVIPAGGQQRALAVWDQSGFFFFMALLFNFCNFIDVTCTLPEVCGRLCLEWVSILHGQNF